MVGGSTQNHLILVDLRSKKLDGGRLEALCDQVNIFGNKNTVPGDVSALIPSGLRLGAPAMTSRGLVEKDFVQIAEFIDRALAIALEIKPLAGKKLSEFKAYVH